MKLNEIFGSEEDDTEYKIAPVPDNLHAELKAIEHQLTLLFRRITQLEKGKSISFQLANTWQQNWLTNKSIDKVRQIIETDFAQHPEFKKHMLDLVDQTVELNNLHAEKNNEWLEASNVKLRKVS